MDNANREWLTTGQAAKLCSVKPDTILKWIKRGRLHAERTPGGHYRIAAPDLEPLALTPRPTVVRREAGHPTGHVPGQPLRCWEYLGNGGTASEECQQCIVFRSRASWCFQMVEKAREMGHSRQFCSESCDECTYYKRVRGLATSVLVITVDRALRESLLSEEREDIRIRFARNGYEASAIVTDLRPAFIVIDHDLLKAAERLLLDRIADDSRLSGVRVILAVAAGKGARVKAALRRDVVVAVIEKPFRPDRIAGVIDAFPVEVLGNETHAE